MNVTVSVEYSPVNYKDSLAMSGRAPVIRQFPLIPGIDFAGTVWTWPSSNARQAQSKISTQKT